MAIEQVPPEPDLRDPRKRRRELSALLWLCGWGGAAAIALTALAITSQTKSAGERLRSIFAVTEPAAIAQIRPRLAELESQTQRLSAQINALNAERDRLIGRMALLESTIDDMTGSIKRQAAETAALAAKAAKMAVPAPTPAAPAAMPAAASTPIVVPAGTAAAAPQPNAPVPATEAVPLPPTRVAAAPTNEAQAAPSGKNEFGIDLGGAITIDGVRQRWTTIKANFGPLLGGMHPLAAREQRSGKAAYRLVVGPLPNGAAAAGLCTHFTAARTPCKSVKFDGEELAQH
jgi:hypothetical protein